MHTHDLRAREAEKEVSLGISGLRKQNQTQSVKDTTHRLLGLLRTCTCIHYVQTQNSFPVLRLSMTFTSSYINPHGAMPTV